jgi:ATP-binding cassette, subfamily B, bacterial
VGKLWLASGELPCPAGSGNASPLPAHCCGTRRFSSSAATAWPLALALLPLLAYVGLAPLRGRVRIDTLGSDARAALGQLGAHVTETIQGMSDLIAFQAASRRRAEFERLLHRYRRLRLALLADLARQSAALETATGLGGLAVAATGAVLATRHSFDPTLLPLAILVSVAAFLPVSEIAEVSRQLADTIASTKRLHAVQTARPAVIDGRLRAKLPSNGSALRFDAVRFTYPGRSEPALRDVSFTVQAGTTVALVGPSGAGKTTIANLILRFSDPDEGAILLDGLDLRTLTLESLRQRIALVAQDTYLFNDTLAANIRLARPSASDKEVLQALERAALGSFLTSLPEGLATPVGERGMQLSGGQRQRVAIARAFLKDAPVLVLDEATSHLDAISERQIQSSLAQLMRNRTTIVIAHRPSTIRGADCVLSLEAGRVVASLQPESAARSR